MARGAEDDESCTESSVLGRENSILVSVSVSSRLFRTTLSLPRPCLILSPIPPPTTPSCFVVLLSCLCAVDIFVSSPPPPPSPPHLLLPRRSSVSTLTVRFATVSCFTCENLFLTILGHDDIAASAMLSSKVRTFMFGNFRFSSKSLPWDSLVFANQGDKKSERR